MKIKTTLSILLLLSLLTGCWVLPFKSETPDEYYERKSTVESIYPSTQEDVIRQLGQPGWVEKRGNSTYFIYQTKVSEHSVGFIIYLPVWVGRDTHVFCLFLEFDEANHLVRHSSKSHVDDGVYDDCIDYFFLSKQSPYGLKLWRMNKEIGIYCPNADLGHADAQKHIGDLYYFGTHDINIDLIRAHVWYSLAAKSGNKEASDLLDLLVKEMSPQQLIKAQIQLDEWEPGQCERDLKEAIPEVDE